MSSGPRRGLARRLFGLGVLQLALAVGAAIAIGALTRPARPPHLRPPGEPPLADGPPGAPPDLLAPPPPPFDHPPHHPLIDPGLYPPLVTFGCGLVIIGLGAWLTARWLVRPLARLASAARALGGGDLSARSGLSRGDELGEVGQAFDEMAVRIRTLLLSEKELLANVSHELRTPLARIRVALDLAAEGDAEAARASLGEIATDLGELEVLIDDILTATRFELAAEARPGAFALHREELEAAVVAEQAAARFRGAHSGRPLNLSTPSAGAPRVAIDPMLFRRVLDNLLENAHKYSPDPSAPIDLIVRAETRRVIFEVRDRGVGIAARDLPHVFSPFFRGERSRDRRSGGVGLGLTLARRIVEAHGGAIALDSVPGEGTTATVSLPVSAV